MNMVDLWSLQAMMLMLMGAGAILKIKGVLSNDARSSLTDLVLDFLMPCNIINSFMVDMDMETLKKFAELLLIALLVQAFVYTLSKVLYNRKPDAIARVMRYCTIVSNSGFLGLPVAQGIFGSEGLMYAAVFIVPMRIMMFSAGISCFEKGTSARDAARRVVFHPCMIAVYIGLLYMMFHSSAAAVYMAFSQVVPGALSTVTDVLIAGVISMVSTAARSTTCITMVIIGMILADIRPHHLMDLNIALLSVLRLFVVPAAVFAGCSIAGVDPFLRGVSVVMSCMPCGSTAPIFAARYACDFEFATKCVLVTTLLSMISIPLWCIVL